MKHHEIRHLFLILIVCFPHNFENKTDEGLWSFNEMMEMNLDFEVNPTKHYLPFGRINIFTKYMYIFSHILWAYYVTRKYKDQHTNIIFTLSDWVFYFLSKKNVRVI